MPPPSGLFHLSSELRCRKLGRISNERDYSNRSETKSSKNRSRLPPPSHLGVDPLTMASARRSCEARLSWRMKLTGDGSVQDLRSRFWSCPGYVQDVPRKAGGALTLKSRHTSIESWPELARIMAQSFPETVDRPAS